MNTILIIPVLLYWCNGLPVAHYNQEGVPSWLQIEIYLCGATSLPALLNNQICKYKHLFIGNPIILNSLSWKQIQLFLGLPKAYRQSNLSQSCFLLGFNESSLFHVESQKYCFYTGPVLWRKPSFISTPPTDKQPTVHALLRVPPNLALYQDSYTTLWTYAQTQHTGHS